VLEHCNLDRSFSAADDCTWTNRIIVHCADVINHCFQNGSLDQTAYQALRDYGEAWMAHKPRSFNAIFQSQPSGTQGDLFTKTWYTGDAIAKGIQHYHLSKILLVAHDPNIPRLGLQRKTYEQTVDVRSIQEPLSFDNCSLERRNNSDSMQGLSAASLRVVVKQQPSGSHHAWVYHGAVIGLLLA
jgi:hypothetical protein